METTYGFKTPDPFSLRTTSGAVALFILLTSWWLARTFESHEESLLQDLALIDAERAQKVPAPLISFQPAPRRPPPPTERELAQRQLAKTAIPVTAQSLLSAVSKADRATIDLLLKAGVDINAADDAGFTCLMTAVTAGNAELAEHLINSGALVNKASATGETALMLASVKGDLKMLNLLLDHGADVNATDIDGHNALHYSIGARQPAAVTLLVKHHAEAHATCCPGKDGLVHSFESGNYEITARILELQPQPLAWSVAASEALVVAVRARDTRMINLLIRTHTGSPRLQGRRETLLAYAVVWNDLDAVKLLLDAGHNPNVVLALPASDHFSRLIESKRIKYYLQHERKMTALMLAAALGRTEIVATLLEKGARRGALTAKHNMAAVHFAAQQDNVPAMQLLLGRKAGADETRVEISLSKQRAVLYRHGAPAISTRISTGRKGYRTPEGTFVVTDKHRERVSSLYEVKMPYFMRLSCSEFGLHEGAVPNYPASHGCIRIPRGIAREFYKFVDVGTIVRVVN
jgi:ankyrin repeat protein